MEEFFAQTVASKYNFWIYIALMMIGLYAMIGKHNLVKKIIGMNIFQTAIILYYVSLGVKRGGTLPVIEHGPAPEAAAQAGHEAAQALHEAINAADYLNPLPHVLMLTAIVVSVATLGVALALVLRVHRRYGTLDEPEIIEKLRQ